MKRWILVVLFVILPAMAWGACTENTPAHWYPDTLTVADIQACLDNAAFAAGDTIHVPSGSATWTSYVQVTDAGAILVGATTGCPGACVDGTTITASGGSEAFNIAANNVRLSGITFSGAGSGTHGIVHIDTHSGPGGLTGIRVDHNHFTSFTDRGIVIGLYRNLADSNNNANYALIDNNKFDGTTVTKAIQGYGGGGDASVSSWLTPLVLGAETFVFVEDNTFTFTAWSDTVALTDFDNGAKTVWRFNTVTMGRISWHGMEDSNPATIPWRSSYGWEVYGNTFTGDGWYRRVEMRGGTGVVFNNTFNGTISGRPILYYYDRGDIAAYCALSTSCDGTIQNVYDGNTAGMDGYPCYQQIGMTGSAGITPKPAYQWGNTWNSETVEANQASITFDATCGTQHVQFGRDVRLVEAAMRGTTLPATCAVDTAYWKTNEGYWNSKVAGADGVLYKCTETNVWTPYYTPYPYPHPLRSGLSAPTGVTTE